MTDCMKYNPFCKEDDKYCGSWVTPFYFISFMLLSNNVLLNLFILSLIEQFENFFNVQNSCIQTYIENIDKIKTVWCKFSSENSGGMMHTKFLARFLLDIG